MSPRPRRRASRLWQCVVALEILGCLATGFASALLPDDPSLPAGIYDGDDDDAAATPEPLDGAVALIVDTTGVSVPAPAPAPLGVSLALASLPRPLAVRFPLLRSPPL